MTAYEQLLHLAFPAPSEEAYYLTPTARQADAKLRRAAPPELSFRFEQLRLGVGLSLLKLLADLGDHHESRQVLDVLHRALNESRSPEDIDRIVGREAQAFDRLYENLYVNAQGEELLDLFGQTLAADTTAALDATIREAVALARVLDFSAADQDDDHA